MFETKVALTVRDLGKHSSRSCSPLLIANGTPLRPVSIRSFKDKFAVYCLYLHFFH